MTSVDVVAEAIERAEFEAEMDFIPERFHHMAVAAIKAIGEDALRDAFWQAMLRCDDDARVHSMDMPCFSRTLKDSLIDGYLPDELWEHMARVLANG